MTKNIQAVSLEKTSLNRLFHNFTQFLKVSYGTYFPQYCENRSTFIFTVKITLHFMDVHCQTGCTVFKCCGFLYLWFSLFFLCLRCKRSLLSPLSPLCSWNDHSIPQLQLHQLAVSVEGSSEALLGSTQHPGFHYAQDQERKRERDSQGEATNGPEEGDDLTHNTMMKEL